MIILRKHPLIYILSFTIMMTIMGGCSSKMPKHYDNLRSYMDAGDYQSASKYVEKSKKKYGKKNLLIFHLDLGMTEHLAGNYKNSTQNFEKAKMIFEDNYQKSISAGMMSMLYNDQTMPYYGQNFERVHITVFEALNYLLEGNDSEAIVEAKQADIMFRTFAAEKNYKHFYKDDGFIRYFMGLVYENAGEINDAHISYCLALKAYENSTYSVAVPQDLIDDAYTTALKLGLLDRAKEIKEDHPKAKEKRVPKDCGECIIINYNGHMAKKIDNIIEFALYDIFPYINQVEVDNEQEAQDFEKARSVYVSTFANDYIKVAFPKYQKIPNAVHSFNIISNEKLIGSYIVQDLSKLASECLEADTAKIYHKALARAAVKYIIGKTTSKAIEDSTKSEGLGVLTQIAFNVYASVTESADKRAWYTLPETIAMSRFYLPIGENEIMINCIDMSGNILYSKNIKIDIIKDKKNFIFFKSKL